LSAALPVLHSSFASQAGIYHQGDDAAVLLQQVWSAFCSCSDLFGLKHFAANYTTLQFAPAMGSYLLATEVTGWLYDRAAAAHGDIHQVGCSCCTGSVLLNP
jgi:hypothetical protein